MEKLADGIGRVLGKYTSSEVSVTRIDAGGLLSPFLRSAFAVRKASFLGHDLLVAAPTDAGTGFPATRRRLAALEEALGERVVLFSDALSANQKRALIDSGTGFVCADGSMYLPGLGLSIQETSSRKRGLPKRFSPSEQICFLYCLYSGGRVILQSEAMEATGLSVGSVSRAFSMLSDAGMLEYEIGGDTGRLRSYRVADERAFFERGMAPFGDPVKEVVMASSVPDGLELPRCGLSALAQRSDLLPPRVESLAASPKQAEALDRDAPEPAGGWGYEISVLRYDPGIFAEAGDVDAVTMLKTIGDLDDERVGIALRQAMEGYGWYTG